ncbi:MAG: hypothetical protein JW944_10750 [Deltaproteobacteria bacterium]|nr:hypothetical protein [Deltaproteobacteria bacterium]
MEKIIVLKRNNGDDILVECLRALFPECAIEVHERIPVRRMENILEADNDDTYDKRLEEYLSFL